MKHFIPFISAIFIFTTFFSLSAVVSEQNVKTNNHSFEIKNSQVNFGNRPPVDLKSISKDSYHQGKIRVQFTPDLEKTLENAKLNADDNDHIKIGIKALDKLNEKYAVNEYEPLLKNLYKISPASLKYKERHKAWGFHLWYELQVSSKADITEVVKDFLQMGEIRIAEPVYKKRLIEPIESRPLHKKKSEKGWQPNDPLYEEHQWNLNNTGQEIDDVIGFSGWDCNMENAWEKEKGDTNVIVAIMDNGVDFNHEDLSGNMWPYIGPQGRDTKPEDHGTHVAGTIAAVTNNELGIAGIAGGSGDEDGVRIMTVDMLSENGLSGMISFIYAADNGAAISQNSWGYENPGVYNQSALDGIDYFNEHGGGEALLGGGITLFAAGNENDDGEWYPAYYGYDDPDALGAISVASHDNRGERSGFSNYGEWIDITAPGTNIPSTASESYYYLSGTSMSCPHVSGVAALVISKYYGRLVNTDLKEIIINSANPDLYESNPDYEGLLGYGLLDAYEALELGKDYLDVPNPREFQANAISTTSIEISWELNEYNHEVIVGWAPYGEKLGEPVDGEEYEVGDNIEDGGKIIYKGIDTTYTHEELNIASQHNYKIWSLADEDHNNFNTGDYSYGLYSQAYTDCKIITELPFEENFNKDHHILKHCWTFRDNKDNEQRWLVQNWNLGAIDNGLDVNPESYAYINSDSLGPEMSQNASLITPVLDLTEHQEVTLKFDHFFKQWEDVSTGTLFYSIDKGDNWQEIKTWDTTTPNPAKFRKVIEEVGGKDNVRFKWNYIGEWGFHWSVNNIRIMETMPSHYADFSSSHNKIPMGDTIIFEDASTNHDYSSWNWDFGEGANPKTAEGKGPHEVVYDTTGDKNITMITNNKDTLTKPNFINVFEITDKLHWDDKQNANKIGMGETGKWNAAARFKTSDLVYYDKKIITDVNIYIGDLPNSAKVKIWERDDQNNFHEVVNQPIEPEKDSWNTVALDNPLRIDANKELWLGMEYDDPGQGVSPAGFDQSANHDRKGNLLRMDIEDDTAWMPLSYYGYNGNWNMHAILLDDETKYVIRAKAEPPEAAVITGTGVYEENSTAELSASPETNFEFINWTENDSIVHEQLEYSFEVNSDRTFVVNFKDVTYVETQPTDKISIYPNPANEKLSLSASDPIIKVTIVDMMGKMIYNNAIKSREYSINVNDFNPGIYIIRIYTENEVQVNKIQIL